jgi:cobalt-zinc-cadmium efflux system protein
LTVHLVKPEAVIDDDWLAGIVKELHDRFHIEHSTIQLENGQSCQSCELEPDEVV